MTNHSDNNRRIAKNTGLLYFRMLVTLCISLYTSRIILRVLGASDLGVYYVVAGVLALIGILTNTMAGATQRFLSYELGKNDRMRLKQTFSMTLTIHLCLTIIVGVIAETVGFWFLNTQLNIPADRMDAANFVFQFSILSSMLVIIQIPFTAVIFAHEKINIYAYFTILDVILKLVIVFVLLSIGFDKLKLYSVLMVTVTLITFSITVIYCLRSFHESRYRFCWDKTMFRNIFGFTGLNLLGNIVIISNEQVINIFLNIFFGTLVNAARGIAYQLNSVLFNFVVNIQAALRPAIVKAYARGDHSYATSLVSRGSKYCFFLFFLLSFPLILEAPFVLRLWLGQVPEYTISFCRLMLINTLIDSLVGPLVVLAQATGNIKKYQVCTSLVTLLILPLSYLILKLGFNPYNVYWANITISILVIYVRLVITEQIAPFSISDYLNLTLKPIAKSVTCAIVLPIFLINYLEPSLYIYRFLLVCLACVVCISLSIYKLGLEPNERLLLNRKVTQIIFRVIKKKK